ncbi:MAG TPA: ATP-binding protein [Ramlibacter sp.]|nr:ATP-binding protein [Ramlibacter sp.]
MTSWLRRQAPWLALWCAATALGGALLARAQLEQLEDDFDTDARIAHRLLSQRMVQHEAVLATLALLQPAPGAEAGERRLPALYPQILAVARRERDGAWSEPSLDKAEAESRKLRHAVLGPADLAGGRYWLVLAAEPASFALQLGLPESVPKAEWPVAARPARMSLAHEGAPFPLQAGGTAGRGWAFGFSKPLASNSQPFVLNASRTASWNELPWAWIAGCGAVLAVLIAALQALIQQREQRRRAEELLRLGQIGRLNALGELAAGLAHELNQPLTAVMASTQAASRLLDEDPPELASIRASMKRATQQARRASDVVARLRQAIDRPGMAARKTVPLEGAVRDALHLLEPELRRRGVDVQVQAMPVAVHAEPVALEQIIHNLLMNALQALEQVPASERRLELATKGHMGRGMLTVTDTGLGIPTEAMPHLFEPFFSTRQGGLGLGLSLCETLAGELGGRLEAAHHTPRGAQFRLTLPLAVAT